MFGGGKWVNEAFARADLAGGLSSEDLKTFIDKKRYDLVQRAIDRGSLAPTTQLGWLEGSVPLLHLAAARSAVGLLDYLLFEKGLDPNWAWKGGTPLLAAIKAKAAQSVLFLLKEVPRVDVNAREAIVGPSGEIKLEGRTATILAAEQGMIGVVNLLAARGADLDARDAQGQTALEAAIAAQPQHHDRQEATAIALLDAGAHWDAFGRSSISLVDHAALRGQHQLLQAILRRMRRQGLDAAAVQAELAAAAAKVCRHWRSKERDLPVLKALIAVGLDVKRAAVVEMSNAFASRPAAVRMSLLHVAAQSGNIEAVRFLVEECSCDPRQRDPAGYMPHHLAARMRRHYVVEWLVGHWRVPVDAATATDGLTALDLAVQGANLQTVRFLIEQGADPLRPEMARDGYDQRLSAYAAVTGQQELAAYLQQQEKAAAVRLNEGRAADAARGRRERAAAAAGWWMERRRTVGSATCRLLGASGGGSLLPLLVALAVLVLLPMILLGAHRGWRRFTGTAKKGRGGAAPLLARTEARRPKQKKAKGRKRAPVQQQEQQQEQEGAGPATSDGDAEPSPLSEEGATAAAASAVAAKTLDAGLDGEQTPKKPKPADEATAAAAAAAPADPPSSPRPPPLKEFLDQLAPESLLCPITLELFDDPVVLMADGCTYSRAAIEQHLDHCRLRNKPLTAPKTNMVIDDPADARVAPNVLVRSQVLEFSAATIPNWEAAQRVWEEQKEKLVD